MKSEMKTPISYYGGKQNLIKELLPMIPRHIQYVEPFCGGASLFWAKKPSQHEVINDYDLRVANFWQVLQTDFEALQERIQSTLHHEYIYHQAKSILKGECTNKVDYAWAFWVQTQMSYSSIVFGGFAFSGGLLKGGGNTPPSKRGYNRRVGFVKDFSDRLKHTEIFNRDALELIKLKDAAHTFFYFDPPYPEAECGHYEAGKDVYYRLLELLPTLKGKWLMSSYPSKKLELVRRKYGFFSRDMQQNLAVSGNSTQGKKKIECLTWNYQLEGQSLKLFA